MRAVDKGPVTVVSIDVVSRSRLLALHRGRDHRRGLRILVAVANIHWARLIQRQDPGRAWQRVKTRGLWRRVVSLSAAAQLTLA